MPGGGSHNRLESMLNPEQKGVHFTHKLFPQTSIFWLMVNILEKWRSPLRWYTGTKPGYMFRQMCIKWEVECSKTSILKVLWLQNFCKYFKLYGQNIFTCTDRAENSKAQSHLLLTYMQLLSSIEREIEYTFNLWMWCG